MVKGSPACRCLLEALKSLLITSSAIMHFVFLCCVTVVTAMIGHDGQHEVSVTRTLVYVWQLGYS